MYHFTLDKMNLSKLKSMLGLAKKQHQENPWIMLELIPNMAMWKASDYTIEILLEVPSTYAFQSAVAYKKMHFQVSGLEEAFKVLSTETKVKISIEDERIVMSSENESVQETVMCIVSDFYTVREIIPDCPKTAVLSNSTLELLLKVSSQALQDSGGLSSHSSSKLAYFTIASTKVEVKIIHEYFAMDFNYPSNSELYVDKIKFALESSSIETLRSLPFDALLDIYVNEGIGRIYIKSKNFYVSVLNGKIDEGFLNTASEKIKEMKNRMIKIEVDNMNFTHYLSVASISSDAVLIENQGEEVSMRSFNREFGFKLRKIRFKGVQSATHRSVALSMSKMHISKFLQLDATTKSKYCFLVFEEAGQSHFGISSERYTIMIPPYSIAGIVLG